MLVSKFVLFWFILNSKETFCIPSDSVKLIFDYMSSKNIFSVVFSTCSMNESVELLAKSMQVDQYTIFSKPSSSIDELINSIVTSTHKIGIYVNLDCASGVEFFVKASEKNLLKNKYSWFLLGDITQSDKSKLEKCQNLHLMSDVVFAIRNETAFNLFYVYKMSNGSSLTMKQAGFWERNSGIRFATNGSLIHQRRNWEGVLVEGITVLSEFKLNNTEDGLRELADPNFKYHQDKMSRFCFVLFKNFEKLYNMTLNITFTDNWGMTSPNDLRGMNVDLAQGKAELGVSCTTMTEDKFEYLEFSCLFLLKFRSIFTFRAPNYMGSPDSLLLPFSTSIWLSIVAITTIITILMTILQSYNSQHPDQTIHASFITVIGTFFQQGFSSSSPRISERILLVTTLICGMLICYHFSSMIVTVLIRPVPISIVTAEDLAASKLKIAVHDISYFHNYFKDTQNPLIREFYRRKMRNQHRYVSIPEGVELMRTSGYAFYTEESYQYPVISDTFTDSEMCTVSDLEIVKAYMVPSPMRKNTPYRKHINCGLLLMREVGIVARETNRWRATQPKCQGSIEYSSVHFESLTLAYVVYLTGVVLSLVIVFVERFQYRKEKELLRKKKEQRFKTRRFVGLNFSSRK